MCLDEQFRLKSETWRSVLETYRYLRPCGKTSSYDLERSPGYRACYEDINHVEQQNERFIYSGLFHKPDLVAINLSQIALNAMKWFKVIFRASHLF